MSVTIKGARNLDANDYERLVIKRHEHDYQILVKGKNKYKQIITNYRISKDIKGKTDEEQLRDIVEYFLRYSKISYLKDREIYSYYDGKFSTARGTRQLDFQIKSSEGKVIPKMIMAKYISDRREFCDNMKNITSYEICFNSTLTSYEIKDGEEKDCIRFNLIGKEGRLYNFEKDFLREFIGNILAIKEEEAIIKSEPIYTLYSHLSLGKGNYLYCGDVKIRLFENSDLMAEVMNITSEHNNEIRNAKKMQLKLEGF